MKGSLIWNTQRYSSIFILCYLIYIVSFFISENNINFFTWSNFFLSFETRFITSIAFILILVHSFIGLWTVGTDYLTKRTLGFLNKPLARYANVLRNIYSFVFSLLGVVYLLTILYIIWL
ncbi:MAG: succinate dehydrogenase, hydrophobic membrane anchor protein [Gammaproteobacteria bacterium]|nr:succinate dehydrogenase, hydrophobic membrane anchor protein [Gammaproteobacteria bacterium]